MEYQFWAQNRNVTLVDGSGCVHYLNNFNVTNTAPRPESYLNDVITAQAVPEADRAALYASWVLRGVCVCVHVCV